MKRRLLNLVTALSTALCLGACVLWVWSYFTAVLLHRQDAGVAREFLSDRGVVAYVWRGRMPGNTADFPWKLHTNTAGGWGGAHLQAGAAGRFGFGSVRAVYPVTPGPNPQAYVLVEQAWVPWWSVCALLALLPGGRLVWRAAQSADRALARRRRARAGPCPKCGYDLRATPERCPECGNVPTAVA